MTDDRGTEVPKYADRNFKINHYASADILIVVVVGSADVGSLVAYTEQHIDVWANNPRLLWDLREMDFANISLAQIRNLTSSFSEANDRRRGGRTAILVEAGHGVGIGRLVIEYSEIHESPVQHQLFQSRRDAEAWLSEI
jgi:hypothetical protein